MSPTVTATLTTSHFLLIKTHHEGKNEAVPSRFIGRVA